MQPKLKKKYELILEKTEEVLVMPKVFLHPFFPRPVGLVLDSPVAEGQEYVTKKGYGMRVIAEIVVNEMGAKKKYERVIRNGLDHLKLEYILKTNGNILWINNETILLKQRQRVYTTLVMISFDNIGV